MSSCYFAGPKRAITTSSDRTRAQKDIAIYKGLRGCPTGHHTEPHPQRGFVISKCRSAHGPTTGRVVTSAYSYDLLDSVTRGKYLTNPMLEGAGPEARYESWGAALMSQNYSATNPMPVTAYPGLPADCLPEYCPWGYTGYPHYYIDREDRLVEHCIPPPGAKRVSPWHAGAQLGFSGTNAYWGAVNAQPLQGMRLRAPVHLSTQTPKGAWLPAGAAPGVAFCRGKGAIN
jgi:hypothetical protein